MDNRQLTYEELGALDRKQWKDNSDTPMIAIDQDKDFILSPSNQ